MTSGMALLLAVGAVRGVNWIAAERHHDRDAHIIAPNVDA